MAQTTPSAGTPDSALRAVWVRDIVAGVSVAFVLIPQSLAYAVLAGVPAHHGLYASALPPLAAAAFASSPYLQTGPVALTSVLTFGALSALAPVQSADYVALAALLALVVGLTRVVLGVVRAGFLAHFMSQPVLTGFTTAAALLIIASQLPAALGVAAPDGKILVRALWALTHVKAWELTSIILSVITVALFLRGRRLHPLFPGVLVAVLIGVAYSFVVGYDGAVVGEVRAGLPPLSLELPWSALPHLIIPGVVIALVGFAEPAAIARTFAAQDHQPWSPDREFVSQGVANLASGISGGFPVGGSFSRSSVNRMAGGKTRWSGAVTGLVVLAFLPMAGVLSPLPRAILAAIVIAAVVQLIQVRSLIRLFVYSRPQALVAWGTFGVTLALAPRIEWAVLIGIGLGILLHLWRELSVEVRSHYEGTVLRLEPMGVLFFASAPGLNEALIRELAAHPRTKELIIDLTRLGRIDYTGAMALHSVGQRAERAGLTVELTGVPPQARRILTNVLGGDSSWLR